MLALSENVLQRLEQVGAAHIGAHGIDMGVRAHKTLLIVLHARGELTREFAAEAEDVEPVRAMLVSLYEWASITYSG